MPNLLPYGDLFENPAWIKRGGQLVTVDAYSDPLGGTKADGIKHTVANDGHIWQVGAYLQPNTTYTVSLYVWSRPSENFNLRLMYSPSDTESWVYSGYFSNWGNPPYWRRRWFTFTTPGTLGATQRIGFQISAGVSATIEYPLFGYLLEELADAGGSGENLGTYEYYSAAAPEQTVEPTFYDRAAQFGGLTATVEDLLAQTAFPSFFDRYSAIYSPTVIGGSSALSVQPTFYDRAPSFGTLVAEVGAGPQTVSPDFLDQQAYFGDLLAWIPLTASPDFLDRLPTVLEPTAVVGPAPLTASPDFLDHLPTVLEPTVVVGPAPSEPVGLVTHGDVFTSSVWNQVGTGIEVVENAHVDPLGGNTADVFTKVTEEGGGYYWQNLDSVLESGKTYTLSIYVYHRNEPNRPDFKLYIVNGNEFKESSNFVASGEDYWQRWWWTVTPTDPTSAIQEVGFQITRGADPARDFAFWGFQVYELSDPGVNGENIPAYIPHSAAATQVAEPGFLDRISAFAEPTAILGPPPIPVAPTFFDRSQTFLMPRVRRELWPLSKPKTRAGRFKPRPTG